MEYEIKNISSNFERILKEWFSPGESKDLKDLFKNFSVSNSHHASDFKKTEFNKFVAWVQEVVAANPGTWSVITPKDFKAPKKSVNSEVLFEEPVVDPEKKTKAEISNLKANELAWLPYNDETKNLIMHYNNPKELLKAEGLASSLAGRENLRKLFRKRIQELNSQGKY